MSARLLSLVAVAPLALAAAPAERPFPVGTFDAIRLDGSDTLRIVQGPGRTVVAAGDPAALPALSIRVVNNTLVISRRPGSWHDHGATVTVTTPSLRALAVGGSGDATARGLRVDTLAVALQGSGDVTLADVQLHDLSLALRGSGDVAASGRTDALAIQASGSGDVDTMQLAATRVTLAASGSGDVRARASGEAVIQASGSGDVTVTGHPHCLSAKAHGSGDVRCG